MITFEARTQLSGGALFPEEARFVSHAVERRVREFATGRALARQGLAALGKPVVAIPQGRNREPLWPKGTVGSITHCEGYCGVAIGIEETTTAIGIDAEPNAPLPVGVRAIVARDEERAWLDRWDDSTICADRLLFCAKESVYKAWFSIVNRWLGFDDATITVDHDACEFVARIDTPSAQSDKPLPTEFTGRFLAQDGYVVTAVVVLPR